MMNQASRKSPFSEDTEWERKEQWILWRRRSTDVEAEEEVGMDVAPAATAQQLLQMPVMPRARYDAVMRRMTEASRRSGQYNPWTAGTVEKGST